MTLGYLDCPSGVAGDMWLGAMVDAGLAPARLAEGWRRLPRQVATVKFKSVRRSGIAALAVDVKPRIRFRSASETERFLRRGRWPASVRDAVIGTFQRLVVAERAAHGGTGGHHGDLLVSADTVVDLVGVCWGLSALGITALTVSPLPLGLVAPATAHLLKGLAVVPAPPAVRGEEIVTPTGAALVASLGAGRASGSFRVTATGAGAGRRDFPGIPNVVRLLVGTPMPAIGESQMSTADPMLWVVEANLDDCSPEWVAHAQAELLHRGALDAWVTPATMKKGRAGVILSALVPSDRLAAAEATMLSETTTLGVRRYPVARTVLPRRMVKRRTAFGPLRVKQAQRNGIWTGKPEFEDAARLARRRGVALRDVRV